MIGSGDKGGVFCPVRLDSRQKLQEALAKDNSVLGVSSSKFHQNRSVRLFQCGIAINPGLTEIALTPIFCIFECPRILNKQCLP